MNNETYTSIPLGGITRNTPFFNSPDGDMDEAINLRYRHGKVYPVGAPVERTVLQGLDLLYLHKTDQYENAIVYERGGIYAYPITQSDGTETIGTAIEILPSISKADITGITHIGNILVLSAGKLYRALYKISDTAYTLVSIPDKIIISARAVDHVWTREQLKTYITSQGVDANDFVFNAAHRHPFIKVPLSLLGLGLTPGLNEEKTEYLWENSAIAFITPFATSADNYEQAASEIFRVMSNARNNNKLYNPVLLVAALRLYDGSYVAFSDPVFLLSSAGINAVIRKKAAQITVESKEEDGETKYYLETGTNRYSSSLLTYDIAATLQSNIPAVEDIIDGVSFFISEINIYADTDKTGAGDAITGDNANLETLIGTTVATYEPGENSWSTSSWALSSQINFAYDANLFVERIKNSSVFYEACHIPLNEISTGKEFTLPIDDLPGLTTKPYITIADNSNFTNVAGLYLYNSQLHLYGYDQDIPTGFDAISLFIPGNIPNLYNGRNILISNNLQDSFSSRSKIALQGAKAIIKGENHLTGASYTITQSLMSEDNALLCQGISPVLAFRMPYAKSLTIIYSYYIDGQATAENAVYRKIEAPLSQSGTSDIALFIDGNMRPILGEEISKDEYKSILQTGSQYHLGKTQNTLRVSETSNPFVFPVEKTYTLGQGQILGLAVATQPISQGQFGQYPLYAFCSDGIWALQVGSADTSYSVQAPVSFDVCNNARSITPVLGGIIFSTASGLKLLSGGQATRIDEPLDGATINAGQYPALTTLISTLYNTPGITDDTLFTTYLAEADITYNYREDELIIFNPRYPYTYVLSGGRWSKRAGQIQSAINNYPQVFLQKDNRWYDLTRESTSLQPMFLLTRPCKFGTTHYKRIGRSILRAYAHQAHINLLLLGSNDGTTFALVNKITTGARNRTDIHLGRGIKSYKYYAYAIAIEPQDESVLTCELGGIDLALTQALNGFIR